MEVTLNQYQRDFFFSTARFPCLKCGWGTGKRLDIREWVRVYDGWKRLGDIEVGDIVIGRDGGPVEVLGAHEITTVPVAYRLRFDSGEEILADPEHLWYTESYDEVHKARGGDVVGSVKTTQQIVDTLRSTNGYQTNHRIPICDPVVGVYEDLPVAPYTFGAWLGDGSSRDNSICSEDSGVLERIELDGYETRLRPSTPNLYHIGTVVKGELKVALRELGVLQNKHIPHVYLHATIDQRMELLRGLMDTDGHVDKRGGVCEYTSTCSKLAEQVLELVNGLGIKARMYIGDATLNGRFISKKYRIAFKTKKQVFSLERKQSRVDAATDQQMSRRLNRWIVGYEVVRDIPMRCLTVDSPDGLFLVTKSCIPTHNTMTAIFKVWSLANAYRDNLILVCRENFVNLKNSTMSDFELYTGQKVKVQAKSCTLPNGSTILFSHAGDVAGVVQNINLGAFFIEQGEEFISAEVFAMLAGGRLRRKLEVDERYFAQLDAEFAKEPPKPDAKAYYDYLRTHSGADALNQGIVIANANGRNWVWQTWKRDCTPVKQDAHVTKWTNEKRPQYEMWETDSYANAHNLKPDFVANWEAMKHGTELEQRKYRIYVMNSDEEADLPGAYYDKCLGDCRREGRIGKFKPDRNALTHTVWDLGINDSTAIWFVQYFDHEVRLIHYYEAEGVGVEHYIRYLRDVRERMHLVYGQHFWPHDGKKRELGLGVELSATAASLGLDTTPIPRERKVVDGIERVRKMFPDCTFDEDECRVGLEALEHYHRMKNSALSTDEKTAFLDTPVHDWASNGADAFRYVSKARSMVDGATELSQEIAYKVQQYKRPA